MRISLSFLFTLTFIPMAILAQDIEGHILLVSGKEYKTRIKGSKEWITHTSDTVLRNGLRVKTDESSYLRIILENRFLIFVSNDSDLNFTKLTDSDELITILKGNILIISLSNKIKGIINTPTAEIIRDKTAEIIISVNAQDGTTELVVLKEDVQVKNLIQADNNYKTIKQGTFSKILPQVLPTEPTSYREADIEDLIKKIKIPFAQKTISTSLEPSFDIFIEEFRFEDYFSDLKNKKNVCKDMYVSPLIPVEQEKNIVLKDSSLFLNIK